MSLLKLHHIYGNRGYENISAIKNSKKREKEDMSSALATTIHGAVEQKKDSVEISSAGRLAAEQTKGMQELAVQEKRTQKAVESGEETLETAALAEDAPETAELEKDSLETAETEEEATKATDTSETEATTESESIGGKVAVNEGKRARQIAAAKDQAQVQQVLALLHEDLSDCKSGKEKGWCDDSEIAKVEALISKAQARMSQVPRKSDEDQGGLDAFAMASLM